MKAKRLCASRVLYAAMGVGGVAMPLIDAIAENHAMPAMNKPATQEGTQVAAAQVDGDTLPMTKNVVTRAAMDAMDTQDGYADAIKNVAGVSSNNAKGSANDSVKIRGIQLNLFTDYRLNGGLPITGVISFPTEDKDRIEALKGANALMFGIASPAGIINLVTKRALDKDVSTLTLSGNSFGQYGAVIDVGRKFGSEKQFGVRVNLSGAHLENGIEDASGNGKFASVAADWRVNDKLTLLLDVEQYRKDVVEQAAVSLSPVDPRTGTIPVPRIPDPTRLLSGTWDVYHPRTNNTQLRAEYQLDRHWKTRFEVSRSHSDRSRIQDRIDIGNNLATGIGDNNVTFINNQYTTRFARAEVLGDFVAAGFRHDLTFGVAVTDRLTNTSTISNVQPPGQKQNIYNPVVLAPPRLPTGPIVYTPSTSKNTGVYVYDTVSLGRSWKVLLGMRQTSSEFANSRGETDSKTPSPAVGALYDIAPNTTVYASYMKGLEEGATAPTNRQTVNPGQILPPAVATQTELGVRTTYFKGVSASLAYFNIVRANAVTNPQTGIFESAGTNNFRGLETTIAADIGRQWTVNAAGQVMRAVQDAPTDINGKTPENTPRVIASLSGTYRVAQVPGLRLTAGSSFVGERYINPQNQGTIPGVALFSIGAGYSTVIAGYKTALQVTVDNLANKRYWNSVTTGTYGAGMDRSIKFNAKIDL